MKSLLVQLIRVRVELGVIEMKRYSKAPKDP